MADTQQAVVQLGYGPVRETLVSRMDFPIASPSETQVQIKVRAASVNPIDWQMIEGNRRMITRRTFPFVPLFDLAGEVCAVGRSVKRFQVGDIVHCDNEIHGGGASQFVNVEEHLICAMPASLGFSEAAAVPLAGQTALTTLDQAAIGAGSSVVVVGASGGVGSFVVQMAKALGASRVIAVCSARNETFVRGLGADEVIDYAVQSIYTAVPSRSVDAVIDCVGGKSQWIAAKQVLRDGGRFVTIARDEDGEVSVGAVIRLLPPILWRRFSSLFGRRLRYLTVFVKATHTLLARVDAMIASGAVKPHVARIYSFSAEGVIAALEASRNGHVVGKVIVKVS
ncbi:NAD(P)-dependent alcohol dehydrogenase [Burkholderia stagnalis]